MTDSLDLWLGKPAPRYTSYPPAPFFHAGVGESAFHQSLAHLNRDEAISLYIHIPFCRSLCLYCGCNTAVTQRPERLHNYVKSLKQEIDLISSVIGKQPIRQLHFGGGTPNSLSNEELRDLFDHLHKVFDFKAVREVAMELDPRVVTHDQIKMLAACGITRVSLGIQDFDHKVQTIINRHQSFEMVADVCRWFRAEGIQHINFDLIYGLPKQSAETITNTAELVCRLQPSRIALFSYAHVPQLKNHQKVLESYGLPDAHGCLALEQISRGILTAHNYNAIGIDHFALHNDSLTQAWRADKLHRCFQGYTEDDCPTILGLGASSISQTKDGYFQNERDEFEYQKIVSSGKHPTQRGFLLSDSDRVHREVIVQLMCRFSCDLEMICKHYGYPVEMFDGSLKQLKPFEEAGLLTRQGYVLRVTSPYRMAVRIICEAFDTYSQQRLNVPSSRTA